MVVGDRKRWALLAVLLVFVIGRVIVLPWYFKLDESGACLAGENSVNVFFANSGSTSASSAQSSLCTDSSRSGGESSGAVAGYITAVAVLDPDTGWLEVGRMLGG